jgi:sterol desaturase/sphingolipid hydroxylase (fatty acid hydroxylase superfamily)
MRLSAPSYYADFFVSAGIIAYLAALIGHERWQVDAEWTGLLVLGFALWTFAEYAIHRWLYHRVPYFAQRHETHHAEPTAFIGAPPLIGIALIVTLFYLPFAATSLVVASGLTAGVLLGYCAYQMLHHAAHHWPRAQKSWLYRLCRHHALHHYHSEHANFGITTSFWDWAFGTAAKVGRRNSVV